MALVDAQFPDLEVDVISQFELLFGPEDGVLNGAQRDSKLQELADKTARERTKYCKDREWWDCTVDQTRGQCSFQKGECKAAPLNAKPRDIVDVWRAVYGPIYASIEEPVVDDNGNLIKTKEVKRPARKRSTTRNKNILVV